MSGSASPEPTLFVGSYYYVVAEVEVAAKEFGEVYIDEHVSAKELAVCPLHPQIYTREEVWLNT